MVDEKLKKRALRYYHRCHNMAKALRKYPYCSRSAFYTWLKNEGKEHIRSGRPGVLPPAGRATAETKAEIVARISDGHEPVMDVSIATGYSRATIYKWLRQYRGNGIIGLMGKEKTKRKKAGVESSAELSKRLDEMQMQIDILMETINVLKKDQRISQKPLKAREKAAIADALKGKYPLRRLLSALSLGKSSYFCAKKAKSNPDKYAALKARLRDEFQKNRRVYGYRRLRQCLLPEFGRLSEKVVRRLMREQGLSPNRKKRAKYSSYLGELSPAAPNLLNRDFSADRPFEKIVTDITEFALSDGKVYLSPAIDCFDGMPIAWTIGTSPDSSLVNDMLCKVSRLVPKGVRCVIHSDRGCHYRWPGWIGLMDKFGFVRSMSKKGCSPDNSACEGFFGTIKNEMFYNEGQSRMTVKEFIPYLEDYLIWFRERRIKESLGYKSMIDRRRENGIS